MRFFFILYSYRTWFHFLNVHYANTELGEVLIYAGLSLNGWFAALNRTRYNYFRWIFAYFQFRELIKFKKQFYLMLEWIPVEKSQKWLKLLRLTLFEALHKIHIHSVLKQFDKETDGYISNVYFTIWELFIEWWGYYDYYVIYPIYVNYCHFAFWLQLVKYNLD